MQCEFVCSPFLNCWASGQFLCSVWCCSMVSVFVKIPGKGKPFAAICMLLHFRLTYFLTTAENLKPRPGNCTQCWVKVITLYATERSLTSPNGWTLTGCKLDLNNLLAWPRFQFQTCQILRLKIISMHALRFISCTGKWVDKCWWHLKLVVL